MTEKLIAILGYKLPGEKVWVTTEDMYEVHSKIDLIIDGAKSAKFIITDIKDEGLVVETLQ
tara:strand:+ start:564 stop:746 length:183 start_codon:yes stop_codon:yes gene_type:complete